MGSSSCILLLRLLLLAVVPSKSLLANGFVAWRPHGGAHWTATTTARLVFHKRKGAQQSYASLAPSSVFLHLYKGTDQEEMPDNSAATTTATTATTMGQVLQVVPQQVMDATYDDIVYQNQLARLQALLQQLTALEVSTEWTLNQTVLQTILMPDIQKLEQIVLRETALPLPPVGCTLADYRAGIDTVRQLPYGYRWILCEVLKEHCDDKAWGTLSADRDSLTMATDFTQIPFLVSALYTQQHVFTEANIKQAKARIALIKNRNRQEDTGTEWSTEETSVRSILSRITSSSSSGSTSTTKDSQRRRRQASSSDSLFEIDNAMDNVTGELRNQGFVDVLLPRVTRQEGRTVSEKTNLATVLSYLGAASLLNNNQSSVKTTRLFAPDSIESVQSISGGFVIRGTNLCNSSAALVAALDQIQSSNTSTATNVTVCYIPDMTQLESNDPILLVLHNDMSPTSVVFPFLSTLAAVATTFMFVLNVYSGGASSRDNIQVASNSLEAILTSSTTVQQLASYLDLVVPMALIVLAHEISHWAIASRDGFKMARLPIGLPSYPSLLPFLPLQTRLATSPPNLSSLFDFAAIGPLVGLITSGIFLFVGLQETAMASTDVLNSYPTLPVSVLKLSTLGGTLVDSVVTGGTLQYQTDESTAISLHPYAIAGFTGLVIQALELLPLGANDGGRLSLALFGRLFHSIVGATVWTGLLLTSLFVDPRLHTEVLVSAWVAYNVCQNDAEIPCRDEVTQLDVSRGLLALVLWIAALLIITPLA